LNGKQFNLVEVIAHILKFLKTKLLEHLKRADHPLEATDFHWVITVPAIWKARGKQMMREAGYRVGTKLHNIQNRFIIDHNDTHILQSPIICQPSKVSSPPILASCCIVTFIAQKYAHHIKEGLD